MATVINKTKEHRASGGMIEQFYHVDFEGSADAEGELVTDLRKVYGVHFTNLAAPDGVVWMDEAAQLEAEGPTPDSDGQVIVVPDNGELTIKRDGTPAGAAQGLMTLIGLR